jgi:hypothetical protein
MLHTAANGCNVEDVATDVGMITMGINPTARSLHEGHYLTLLQYFKAMRRHQGADGLIFIDNREFDFPSHGHLDVPVRLPSSKPSVDIHQQILDFVVQMSRHFQDWSVRTRLKILKMSEWMAPNASEASVVEGVHNGEHLYKLIQARRGTIEEFYPEFLDDQQRRRSPIVPVCPSCYTGSRDGTGVQMYPQMLLADCQHATCHQERFIMDLQHDHRWCIHYAIDPVRDALLARQKESPVLHVFGGDYGMPWGYNGIPKAKRMSDLMERVMSKPEDPYVEHFVGPLLTRGGKKLAKSNGDACAAPDIGNLEKMLQAGKSVIDLGEKSDH